MKSCVYSAFISIVLWTNGYLVKAQPCDFRLTVSTWNYSTVLFTGSTRYILSPDSLMIQTTTTIDKKVINKLSQKIPITIELYELSCMDLSMFSNYYNSPAIMPTSGEMIIVKFEQAGTTKEITFHAYRSYLFSKMIEAFNTIVPEEYKIKS